MDAPALARVPVFYFEATVKGVGGQAPERPWLSAAVGFTRPRPLDATSLWAPDSFHLHATGVLHGRHGPGPGPTDVHYHPFSQPTLPPYGLGDTVGAGIDWGAGEVFFTHNGKDLGGAGPVWARRPNPDPREYLVPAVGLVGPGEAVTVNFGARPFVFDLAARVAATVERMPPPARAMSS